MHGSQLALRKFGWHFLIRFGVGPGQEQFGALPFIFGTLVSSAMALLIAVPLSIATAIYLTELAPPWLRQPLTLFIELLAAVPSVILGLWGIVVMVPWLREHLFPWLQSMLGFLPFFQGPDLWPQLSSSAGIILAIMILPIITSVSREILQFRAGSPARSGLRAGGHPLGSDPHRGARAMPKRACSAPSFSAWAARWAKPWP